MTRGKSLYGPGTPLYVNQDTMCTLTAAGTDAAGRKVGLTAGHGDVNVVEVEAHHNLLKLALCDHEV